MPFQRGDIVWLPFTIPHSNRIAEHPALIISNHYVYENDECYIAVMLTSSSHVDRFTFEISAGMLTKPSNKTYSQARCHLITYLLESHIPGKSPHNRMKKDYVDRLVQRIVTASLEEDD